VAEGGLNEEVATFVNFKMFNKDMSLPKSLYLPRLQHTFCYEQQYFSR